MPSDATYDNIVVGAAVVANRINGGRAYRAPPALKKEFLDWFGKSHATNPDGTPAVVYRGEHGTPPRTSNFIPG